MTVSSTIPDSPVKARKPHFTAENARAYQERAAIIRTNRRDADMLALAIESKAEQHLPDISAKVRGSLAMSLLRQSSLLSAQRVKSYESIVGAKGKVGLMEALASLADSAAKVFQWSQEQSAGLIVNGSFTQITQVTQNCGPVPTIPSVPPAIDIP